MTDGLLQGLTAAFKPDLFVNHYGSSEIYTFTIDQNAPAKPGSAGRAGVNQMVRVAWLGANSPAEVAAPGIGDDIVVKRVAQPVRRVGSRRRRVASHVPPAAEPVYVVGSCEYSAIEFWISQAEVVTRRAVPFQCSLPAAILRPHKPVELSGSRDCLVSHPDATDHFSRSLLACHGLRSVATAGAKPVFRTLFRAVGLPEAIRSDNGAPFASTGIHGLSALNVWWMQLGIVHQRIPPSSPQENGTHERMHRDLKRETTRPASSSLRAQQRRFNAFRVRYNDERPHEGIGDRTPSSLWTPSPVFRAHHWPGRRDRWRLEYRGPTGPCSRRLTNVTCGSLVCK